MTRFLQEWVKDAVSKMKKDKALRHGLNHFFMEKRRNSC